MKQNTVITCFLLLIVAVMSIYLGAMLIHPKKAATAVIANRPVQQVAMTLDGKKVPSIAATKLPAFIYHLTDRKFDSVINAADKVSDYVKATISHTAYAQDTIDAEVSVNKDKHDLVVTPEDIPNIKPGQYKLSLSIRTEEGIVHIDQDFTWGVIAVNTNKSIYQPGETAKLGIGVLNDHGDTLCKSGLFNHVDDLSMEITDPNGSPTHFSIKDNTIKDSGQCGPVTVTNDADFQASYKTTTPGIYQMTVTAVVYGKTRQIEDYFKVDPTVQFDVERNSFPTRIYPGAPYPVTFTVTAAQDYQGKISDIVPDNFLIEHISDNGTTQTTGGFTKIIWSTNLKAGSPKTFTYFIKFPMVSPEFYLLGPITIGNFKEARQWQIASDAINSSTGQVMYEDNGSQNTWNRLWSGTSFGAQTSMSGGAGTPTNSKWFSEASSPLTNEKLIAVLDADTTDVVYLYRYDGSWHQDFRIVLTVTNLNPTRGIDVAYEQLSGDALFVYSQGLATSNAMQYYSRHNGTWSSVGSVGTAATTYKHWIKLAPEANSDDIALAYENTSGANNFVGAYIWSGSTDSWDTTTNHFIGDSTGTQISGSAEESFAIAWESSNQVPMLMWGTTGAKLEYRRFTGSSWTAEADTGHTYAANVDWVNASSDPRVTSNSIAIGTVNVSASSPACEFTIWDGSSWTYGTSIACNKITANGNHRTINVAYESNTGHAVWVYVTNADATHLRYSVWNGSSFSTTNTQVSATAQTNPLSIQMYRDPNTAGIVVLYDMGASTANAALWDVEWDGSSWSTLGGGNGGAALFAATNGVQIANETAEAFGFGFDQYLETLSDYKFFANTNSTDVGSSLTAQDNAFSFNTANPDFRLRLLLYYNVNDSVGASGRSYKLQFVDPGSGTCAAPSGGTPASWTDVGTGSSTLIAYKDNATPTDGSNLTANASDPVDSGKTTKPQTYEEQNNFTNSTSSIAGDQAGEWDFSLHDNTVYDKNSQTFCFRVTKDTGRVLSISNYPQITTASSADVLIQGGSRIRGGTQLR